MKLIKMLKGFTEEVECLNFVDYDNEEKSKAELLVSLSKNPAIRNPQIKRVSIEWDVNEQAFRDYFVGTVEIRPIYGYIYLKMANFVRKLLV